MLLARDLVNEPANMLGPVEFAARAKELEALGVKVEILTEKEMKKLGMGSLLGVAQGSPRGAAPGGHAVERRQGQGQAGRLCRQGRHLRHRRHFDQAGRRHGGHEGRHGRRRRRHRADARAGRAQGQGQCRRHHRPGREHAVDGNAQRPGDIVTSMSGQTIEVLNTDAEGRLVLADALWYCNDRFKPKFMVNLATLTGAIIVALGQDHAGLFSNNDELAAQLTAAGLATQERLWRMPLGADYDKLIDSKNADMKNIGGRYGGAITAAQFLQRFVKDTPWAHLDIAGTAMGSPSSEINQSWGSGFGVRLLDRLVRDHYEG